MNLFTTTRVLTVGAAFALFSTVAMADDRGTPHCHNANGGAIEASSSSCCYNPSVDGPTNVNAYPYCPGLIDNAAGSDQYGTLDRSSLAHTHVCPAGQNCGPPIELGELTEFYSSTGLPTANPAPAPVVAQAPAPVITQAPVIAQAPVVPAAAPTVVAPAPVATGGISGIGLGGGVGPLLVGGVAAAALGGIIWAIADNDSSSDTVR